MNHFGFDIEEKTVIHETPRRANTQKSKSLLLSWQSQNFFPFVHLIRFVAYDLYELLSTSPFIMGYLNICAANFISPFTRSLLCMYDALGS